MKGGFYYDIVCPYAYIAFSLLHRSGVFRSGGLRLRPILLGGLFKLQGTPSDPNEVMPKGKAHYIRSDIKEQARLYSVPISFHPRHPISTVTAMRLIHMCEDERDKESLTHDLYRSYWSENVDIDDEGFLNELAHRYSIGDFSDRLEQAKEILINATDEAFQRGVFGVPCINTDERIYFGSDRLVLLSQFLGLDLEDAPWPRSQEQVDFYFDFSSPYSYLAWIEIKKAISFGVRFRLIPVLLGAIFKELGIAGIPMQNSHPHKLKYYWQDMSDWAEFRGKPFNFSSHFPIRSILPLRVFIVDNNTLDCIFEAAWAEDLDVGNPSVLISVLNKHGFDGDVLVKRTDDLWVKESLRQNTSHAIERGVFGVPTFFIKGQMVFGQDRFPLIKNILSKPGSIEVTHEGNLGELIR
jgi:2-hydroxychromene-2-carboxylate isomerase